MIDLGVLDPADVPPTADAWLDALPDAVGFRWPGRQPGPPIAIVTLLHGNEPSGFRALHHLLRAGVRPAVDAVVVLGAVDSTRLPPRHSHRQKPGGRDLNRCFGAPFDGPERERARRILEFVRDARPRWLVDLHNNSGHNPSYGVVTSLGAPRLGLVSRFARRAILTGIRLGALIEALDPELAAVTIECGRAGDPAADATAARGLETLLSDPDAVPDDPGVEVLRHPVRICLSPDASLAFGSGREPGVTLTVDSDIDRHNFQELDPGTRIGWLTDSASWPLVAHDEGGREVSRSYFAVRDGVLETCRAIVPMMMTTNAAIAQSDCLFYLVEPG